MVYDLVLKVLQKLKSLDFHSALWGRTTDALVSKKRQCSYCIYIKLEVIEKLLQKLSFLD